MSTPFVYDEPVGPAELVGRGPEIVQVVDYALDGRNCRLSGPRRYGKTSLLHAVREQVVSQDAIYVEVNFLGCVTYGDVADRIEKAYARQLDSALRRWFNGLLKTLRPTLRATPGGVGVQAELRAADSTLLDRLALPQRIHERTGRTCVIAYDEFQEIMRIGPGLPGTFRSEIERHGKSAAYIYSGSHPGLMNAMFADRRHAFFGQAPPVEIGPLPLDDLGDFIDRRFADRGRAASDTALDALLETAGGHPQRAMLLAHHLFEQTPAHGTADVDEWAAALAAAQVETAGEIRTLWDACNGSERAVLKTVAHPLVRLTSNEAQWRFGMPKGSTAQRAVRRLLDDGHLVRDAATASGHRVVDPLLALWLATD